MMANVAHVTPSIEPKTMPTIEPAPKLLLLLCSWSEGEPPLCGGLELGGWLRLWCLCCLWGGGGVNGGGGGAGPLEKELPSILSRCRKTL